MGCHTWFYKKIEVQPTYEEVREKMLDYYRNELGYYERHLTDSLSKKEAWLFENKSKQESECLQAILLRTIRRIENRTCTLATLRRYAGWAVSGSHFCERDQQFYEETGWHDLFRINEYPTDELLSLEETLEFIEKNSDKIAWGPLPTVYGKEAVKARLKSFWDEHPTGLICFG